MASGCCIFRTLTSSGWNNRWVGQKPFSGMGINFLPVFSLTYSARFLSGPNSIVSASSDFITSTAFALVQHTSHSALHEANELTYCLLYTSPSPRDGLLS